MTGKELTTEWIDLNEATREVIALSMNELQRHRVMLRPEQQLVVQSDQPEDGELATREVVTEIGAV
jgi:hypothetical protein